MKILSDKMLRIKGSAKHSRCKDLIALLNSFEHRVFCAESTASVQGRARKSNEFASGSKIVGKNQEQMKKSLVAQDSTHSLRREPGRGFC